MKRILIGLVVLFYALQIFSQGCTLTASIPKDTIVCGERIFLSAYGRGQGIAILSENFNTGTYGPGWSSSTQAMWNNPCSTGGADGTTHIWLGNSSPVPRSLTTAVFNLSNCVNAGVTICFDMLFATQGNNAPCEGPDEPDEGVYLQYSTNGGGTWTTINYFDPNGGNDPQFVNWNNWCFQVPAAALTATTQFRWFQDNDSGADYDHWGIDNVIIYCNDPTYNIVWQHDGYNAGPTGGVNPTPVAPHTTTSYVVTMSNGTITCYDTVTVYVRNPVITVNAGNDTTICSGRCTILNGTAKVLVSPAKVVTYSNNELTPITTGFGQVSNIGINVTGINMTGILPNSITQVCINNVFFFGTSIFPPAQITIRDLILSLVCPDGTTIILVPANTVNGGSNPLTGGYNNTCFVPAGPSITTGTAPYTGSWAPNQPFNNLVGCNPNGVWQLNVQMNSALGFGTGTFSGWSITFNDPEISYTGNFNWSPTTNMTNSNTLTPTVCPPSGTTTYTLTVSDTAGCVTQSDAVNVTVQNCCGLSATVNRTQPTCGASNGAINVTPLPAGSYSYLWSNGATTQNLSNIPAGNYCVTITDTGTPACTFDTCIALNSNSTLAVSFTNPVNPTCAGNDGSITFNLAGGTAPYNVTVDTGGAPITFPPLPFPVSQSIPGLPAGTVNVTVTDAQGCIATATATLTAPANCCTFTVSSSEVQPNCGQTNGSISLTSTNGSGNYSYNWTGGQTTSAITNLGAGTYSVTITDSAYPNCFIDTSFSLSNPNAPTISNLAVTNESCTGNDGGLTVTATGGTSPLSILWSNAATTFTITNLAAGNYNFTVTDANSCAVSGNAVVGAAIGCCFLQTSASVVPPTCGLNNASITVNISTAGVPPYTYSINGVNYQTQNVFNNVASGNYNAITLDANSCSDTFAVVVPPSSNSLLVNVASTNVSCFGANDGSVAANPVGGNPPYSYIWNTSAITPLLSNVSAGNYSVTVTDQTGCTGTGSTTVIEPGAFSVSLNPADVTCSGSADGRINATVSGGTSPYFYLWSDNSVNQNAGGLSAGNYSVTVTDNSGCTATASSLVNEPAQLFFTPSGIQVRCAGELNGSIAVSATGGTSPYNFSATQDGVNFFYATNDTIRNLAAGTYTVVLADNNGCTLTRTVLVPAPAPDNFAYNTDSTSCYGAQYNDGAIHIQGTTLQNMPYRFGVDGGILGYTGDFYNLRAGNHLVTAVNFWGCTTQVQIIVPEPPQAIADILPGDTTIQLGESVQLYSNLTPATAGNVTYFWQPSIGLSCTDCANPTVNTYSRSTQYVLTITYNNLCEARADVIIMIQNEPEVYVPNSFSPNGDGNNDKWMIYGKAIKVIDLKIFNRWGEKVYDTNNVFEGWDGTYKGVLQNPSVFVYEARITFLDNRVINRMGSITLLR